MKKVCPRTTLMSDVICLVHEPAQWTKMNRGLI
jgi:hypothetical protein